MDKPPQLGAWRHASEDPECHKMIVSYDRAEVLSPEEPNTFDPPRRRSTAAVSRLMLALVFAMCMSVLEMGWCCNGRCPPEPLGLSCPLHWMPRFPFHYVVLWIPGLRSPHTYDPHPGRYTLSLRAPCSGKLESDSLVYFLLLQLVLFIIVIIYLSISCLRSFRGCFSASHVN